MERYPPVFIGAMAAVMKALGAAVVVVVTKAIRHPAAASTVSVVAVVVEI